MLTISLKGKNHSSKERMKWTDTTQARENKYPTDQELSKRTLHH